MKEEEPTRIQPGDDMTARAYEVLVRGRMSPELIASFDGFEVDTDADGLTRLIGDVPDQARLLGLLVTLNDLHIELVSVNPVFGAPAELRVEGVLKP